MVKNTEKRSRGMWIEINIAYTVANGLDYMLSYVLGSTVERDEEYRIALQLGRGEWVRHEGGDASTKSGPWARDSI